MRYNKSKKTFGNEGEKMNIALEVRNRINKFDEGLLIKYSDLNDITDNILALSKALSRMVKDKQLEKIEKGIFYKPKLSRFGKINPNLNYLKKIYTQNGNFIGIETTAWYTRFSNSIIPDYDTNPNQIIYKNLEGHAVTKGISSNIDFVFNNGLKMILGATYMDVSKTENNTTTQQILTEKFSGTWAISYRINKLFLDLDYTGNLYGPMRLPLLGDLDPRKEYSPTWSIQNIQFTFNKFKNIEIYAGVKNLLNWTPNKGNPFIIARANDPFDKNIQYDPNGNVLVTADNPYALSFDPSYVYGPNQGIRSFFGVRYTLK